MRHLFFVLSIVFIAGCSSSKKITGNTSAGGISEIRFMGEYELPKAMHFKDGIVGGLSGIDYDSKRDIYYMICDDPSTKGPARYYTAKIGISEKGIDTVEILNATTLLNPQEQPYPDLTIDRIHSADLEAMRYDAKRDEMIWASEGQRVVRKDTQLLEDPAIVIMDKDGHYKDSFALPANMHIHVDEKGPRHNSVFEGLTFDDTHKYVYVSLEDAIYEDGPRAGGGDSTAWVRILKFKHKSKKQVAQYAYQVDAVPYPATPPGAFKINGISDILYIGNDKFIVVERAWSTGRLPSDIRIYIADTKNAQDVSLVNSLVSDPVQRPITKKLLLDMNVLGIFIDNIEGVTFGPVLPNGHRTLVFVSDDNFDKKQKMQFLLFEVLP